MPNTKKKELPEYRHGNLRVYLADADQVSKSHNVHFTSGCPLAYSFIPHKPHFEIWVSDKGNYKPHLFHTLVVVRHLLKGATFEDAHHLADKIETSESSDWDALIKSELDRNVNYSREPSLYNGHIHNVNGENHHAHKMKRSHIERKRSQIHLVHGINS